MLQGLDCTLCFTQNVGYLCVAKPPPKLEDDDLLLVGRQVAQSCSQPFVLG